jgi:hypothetical protein
MEWPRNSIERGPNNRFPGFEQALQDYVDGNLTLNEVQELAPGKIEIRDNPDTWVSSNRSNPDGTVTISIGLKEIPKETLNRWKWGTSTDAEQYLVKLSHEYAHVLQETFDGDLLAWLDRGTDTTEDREPYLLLYQLLNALGQVNGLSKEGIYHAQSNGRLQVPVYEDMAETLGSFFIGKDYLMWRLSQSDKQVSPENMEALEQIVDAIYSTWKTIQSESRRLQS